jgi:para-aminobenzoate synthetase/4-amino-4-deoxychorismate lyase
VLTARRPRFELFETMRADPGEGIRNLDRHLERLLASAAYFGFAVNGSELRAALEAEAEEPRQLAARIRLTLDRRGAFRLASTTYPAFPDAVRIAVDTIHPVDPSDPMLFHKTTLRRRYEEAKERHPDAEDVVLTNIRGEVTESTIANVAVQLGDRWWTPPLDCGLLPGTGRAAMLEEERFAERVISVEELLGADQVALVSDTRGWRRAEIV